MDEERLFELFQSLPDIRIKRLFGGQGVYSGELIVALVTAGDIYLKSDPQIEAEFEAAGCRRWTYERKGRPSVRMPYYRLPDDALDDPDVMAAWGAKALAAALRAPRPPKSRKGAGRRRRESASDGDR